MSEAPRGALTPPIHWRQREPYPDPPPGYRLQWYGSSASAQAWRAWGVRPAHVGQCTYCLWVPDGEDAPLPPSKSPMLVAAAAWLAEGRQAAAHVATRRYGFGRARICDYAAEMGCPVPDAYAGRMADLGAFLVTAARLAECAAAGHAHGACRALEAGAAGRHSAEGAALADAWDAGELADGALGDWLLDQGLPADCLLAGHRAAGGDPLRRGARRTLHWSHLRAPPARPN